MGKEIDSIKKIELLKNQKKVWNRQFLGLLPYLPTMPLDELVLILEDVEKYYLQYVHFHRFHTSILSNTVQNKKGLKHLKVKCFSALNFIIPLLSKKITKEIFDGLP